MSRHGDDSIIDARVLLEKQLEQIRAGAVVMVPRLSEEEINQYSGRNANCNERRPKLRRIGHGVYELDSEDDDEIFRQPTSRKSTPFKTITLTDSEDEDCHVLAGPSRPYNSTLSPAASSDPELPIEISCVVGGIDKVSINYDDIENQKSVRTSHTGGENSYPSTSASDVNSNENSSDEAGKKDVIVPSEPAKEVDSDTPSIINNNEPAVAISGSQTVASTFDAKNSNENAIESHTESRIETNTNSSNSATPVILKTSVIVCSNGKAPVVSSNENVFVEKIKNDAITSHVAALKIPIINNNNNNNNPSMSAVLKESLNLKVPIPDNLGSVIMRHFKSDTAPVHSKITGEKVPTVISNLKRDGLIIKMVPSKTQVNCQNSTAKTGGLISIGEAINNTITSMLPASKSTNQSSNLSENLSMPSLDPDEATNQHVIPRSFVQQPSKPQVTSPNVIQCSLIPHPLKPRVTSLNVIPCLPIAQPPKPQVTSPNVVPCTSIPHTSKPRVTSLNIIPCSPIVQPSKPQVTSPNVVPCTSIPRTSKPRVTSPNVVPCALISHTSKPQVMSQNVIPCQSILQPPKLRVKSEAKLGISNIEYNLLKNTPIDDATATRAVNSAISDAVYRDAKVSENISRIAALMKEQHLNRVNHESRLRNISKVIQNGKYTEMQMIEVDIEKTSYNDGLNRRYADMVAFLHMCIDHTSAKDLFCQIYGKFQQIMETTLKKQTIISIFVEILHSVLYNDVCLTNGLHIKIPAEEFQKIVGEIRVIFKLPATNIRKRTTPNVAISKQVYETQMMPQQNGVPSKVGRAETSPYALNSSERQFTAANTYPSIAQASSMTMAAPQLGNLNAQCSNSARCSVSYPNLQNFAHSRPPAYNSNAHIIRAPQPTGSDTNTIVCKEMNYLSNPELARYHGSNPQNVRFRNPPPSYSQHLIRPEINSNMVYQMNANRSQEMIHQRVVSTETIVRPNPYRPPAGPNLSGSSSTQSQTFLPTLTANMSPPLYSSSSIQTPVSSHQSHFIYSPAPGRRFTPSNYPNNSPHPMTSEPYPNQYSQTTTTNMAPSLQNQAFYQYRSSKPISTGILSWNEYQPRRNLSVVDQDYLSRINTSNTNPRTTFTTSMQPSIIHNQPNRIATVVERSQYVSAQIENVPSNACNIRNDSSRNFAFASSQSSFSIHESSLPSFSSLSGDKPLSVQVVNSSLSPSAGPSPNLVSRSEMPISVPIVQSSSSPNIDLGDLERLGSITEPFLKDSEFEEFMKSNEL